MVMFQETPRAREMRNMGPAKEKNLTISHTFGMMSSDERRVFCFIFLGEKEERIRGVER